MLKNIEDVGREHYGKLSVIAIILAIVMLLPGIAGGFGSFVTSTFTSVGNKSAILTVEYFFSSSPIVVFYATWFIYTVVFFLITIFIGIQIQFQWKAAKISKAFVLLAVIVFTFCFAIDKITHTIAMDTSLSIHKALTAIEATDYSHALTLKAEFASVKTYADLVRVKKRIEGVYNNIREDHPDDPPKAINFDVDR